MRVCGDPAAEAPARHERETGDPGQEGDDRGCGDPCRSHNGEAGARRPVARAGRGDRGHRREGRVVEHPQHDQAETERPDARLRARVAPHNRDADRIVDTARQRDSADAGGAAREGECVGGRPLARVEEPLPAPRLERVGGKEEKSRAGGEHRIGVVDRPAAAHEMAHADIRDAQQDEAESGVQHELNLPVGEKPQHHGRNGAIGRTVGRLGHSIGAAGGRPT